MISSGRPSAILNPQSRTTTPVRNVGHDLHVVLDQDDGNLLGFLDVQDEPGHVLLLLDVHPGHGLVHDQDLGFEGQRPAQVDPLAQTRSPGKPTTPVANGLHLEKVDDVLGHDPMVRFPSPRSDQIQ